MSAWKIVIAILGFYVLTQIVYWCVEKDLTPFWLTVGTSAAVGYVFLLAKLVGV